MVAASTHGSPDILRMLIEAGADPKAKDAFGSHALIAAAQRGNVDGLRLLLERGAEAAVPDGGGTSALHRAVSSGILEGVRFLLARGADVNLGTTFSGKVRHGEIALVNLTPLMLAAPFGTPEMIRVLLNAGARVNDKDKRGMTPLMFAASSETQDAEVIKMLLAAGADTKVKTTVGETAMDWALKFKNPAVMAELKKAGAP
jgi:ankyrin repeat protein